LLEGSAKFDRPNLQLPGGSHYREKLLVMPGGTERIKEWEVRANNGQLMDTFQTEGQAHDAVRSTVYPERFKVEPVVTREPLYTEPHFNVDNVVAHGRFTDRTTTTGEPMLFGEELQSQAALDIRKAAANTRRKTDPPGASFRPVDSPWRGFPFEKNWHELMLWKALRMAAEEGKTRFGWTTGQQQIDRYDLSKQINSLDVTRSYAPGRRKGDTTGGYAFYNIKATRPGNAQVFNKAVHEGELADYVGRELADKIIGNANKTQTYSGLDLKTGGEGKRQLYDQMLVQAANRIGKRYGARMEDVAFTDDPQIVKSGDAWVVKSRITGAELGEWATEQAAKDFIEEMGGMGVFNLKGQTTVHSIPITPDLYQALMGEGRPLFQSPLPWLAAGAGAAAAGGISAEARDAASKAEASSKRRPVPSPALLPVLPSVPPPPPLPKAKP